MSILACALAVSASCVPSSVSSPIQETLRKVDGPGEFSKFLTPGTIDRWSFQGKAGEIVIAWVRTSEFDPTLELVVGPEDQERLLLSYDDDGSEARFALRLSEDGEHRIRVRGFEDRGGGNYSLQLQRFTAHPCALDEAVVGTFDKDGRAYHYLAASADQMLTVDAQGVQSWQCLDPKGRPLPVWSRAVTMPHAGEHVLALVGAKNTRYEVTLRSALRRALAPDEPYTEHLDRAVLSVHEFDAREGDFRLIEATHGAGTLTRLIHAPRELPTLGRYRVGEGAALELLPVTSKGGVDRYAARFGKSDRYQLQVLSESPSGTRVSLSDPTLSLTSGGADGAATAHELGLGATAFFECKARAGQRVELFVDSERFDPTLQLFDAEGRFLAGDDDGGGGVDCRLSRTFYEERTVRVLVTSLGGGGSGEFRIRMQETAPTPHTLGERVRGQLAPGGSDLWGFDGAPGAVLVLSVRAEGFDAELTVRDERGVVLGADDRHGLGTGSLLTVRLPRAGRYTAEVRAKDGQGTYQLRTFLDD